MLLHVPGRPERVVRRSAKVELVDDAGALLFCGHDPAEPERRFWLARGVAVERDGGTDLERRSITHRA